MKLKSLRTNTYRIGVSAAGVLLLAGCQFGGLNSLNMPGTSGHGKGSYKVMVDVPDVLTLPQNSPVMVDDVTVGSVSGIEALQRPDGTFYAAVQLSLDSSVHLPANATAKVAQTSLLGSQHIALAPPQNEPAVGTLAPGAHLQLSQASRYPSTEEVLSSLGVVVNNGNLGALQDITDQAYAAVAGRAGTFAELIPRLAELTQSLERQTGDIITALEGLNRVGDTVARSKDSLARTLAAVPGALQVLNENKTNIVDAFGALGSLATVASKILAQNKSDFAADLKDLYPVVKALADNADSVVNTLDATATFPFVGRYFRNAVRGDFLNVIVTFDLTLRRLGETVFTTSAMDPNMQHLADVVNPPEFLVGDLANLSGQAADPFKIPPGVTAAPQGAR